MIGWTEVGKRRVMAAARAAGENAAERGEAIEPVPPLHYLPKGGQQTTSLLQEAKAGDVEAMRRLLKLGARPEGRSHEGTTALHVAVLEGRKDAAELLLSEGCPVDVRDNVGRTPLHAASAKGQVKIARLLLEKGADPTAESEGGWTPLTVARKTENEEMIDLLEDAAGN